MSEDVVKSEEITLDELRRHVNAVLDEAQDEDKADIKIKKVRRNVEKRMKLERGALKSRKSTITQICVSYVEVTSLLPSLPPHFIEI